MAGTHFDSFGHGLHLVNAVTMLEHKTMGTIEMAKLIMQKRTYTLSGVVRNRVKNSCEFRYQTSPFPFLHRSFLPSF